MMSRPRRNLIAAATFVFMLLLVFAPGAHAIEEENQPAPPPPAGCLGSNDPYCEGSGGGGGGVGPGCKSCVHGYDPDTYEFTGMSCIYAPAGGTGGYSYCIAYIDHCRLRNPCLLV